MRIAEIQLLSAI